MKRPIGWGEYAERNSPVITSGLLRNQLYEVARARRERKRSTMNASAASTNGYVAGSGVIAGAAVNRIGNSVCPNVDGPPAVNGGNEKNSK